MEWRAWNMRIKWQGKKGMTEELREDTAKIKGHLSNSTET